MDTVKERIAKDAEDHAFQVPYDGTKDFYNKVKFESYIAGATSERNKTIDECITLLGEDALIVRNKSVLIEQLEKLKL